MEGISNEVVEIIINDKEVDIKDFHWVVSKYIIGEPEILEQHNGYYLMGYENIVPSRMD